MNLLNMSCFYHRSLCKTMSLNFSKVIPKTTFAHEQTKGQTLGRKALDPERGFMRGSETPMGSRPPCALAGPSSQVGHHAIVLHCSPDTGLPLFMGENMEVLPAWPGTPPITH